MRSLHESDFNFWHRPFVQVILCPGFLTISAMPLC
jgi:hypothetical protein